MMRTGFRRCITCDKVLVLTLVAVNRHEPGIELRDGRDMVLHDTEGAVGGWHNNLRYGKATQLDSAKAPRRSEQQPTASRGRPGGQGAGAWCASISNAATRAPWSVPGPGPRGGSLSRFRSRPGVRSPARCLTGPGMLPRACSGLRCSVGDAPGRPPCCGRARRSAEAG